MLIVVVRRSARAAATDAARIVADAVRRRPASVLAIPTGKTAVPFYAALVRLHRHGEASFRHATTFNLDEFVGLGAGAPRSFQAFLGRHFFRHVDLDSSSQHGLDGAAADWRGEVKRYDAAMRAAGGLDVCVLGIGRNGHIAFNEPAVRLPRRTHRQRLTAATRRDSASTFGGDWRAVPQDALTIGMDAIMNARQVLLIATGGPKAAIVHRALEGPVTPRVPASFLQRHPSVTVLLDKAAASRLKGTSRGILQFP